MLVKCASRKITQLVFPEPIVPILKILTLRDDMSKEYPLWKHDITVFVLPERVILTHGCETDG